MMPAMTTVLGSIAHQTWNTVSPVRCAGCGRPDVTCCAACAAHLAPRVHRPTLAIRRALFDVPIFAGLSYQGVAKNVLVSYKENGVTGVSGLLACPLRHAMKQLANEVNVAGAHLVCVPHSRNGWVRRGRHPTRYLVKKAGWADALAPHRALRLASLSGGFSGGRGQKTRTRRERLASPPHFVGGSELAGRRVIVVDDVLTTGITLEYAARAITEAGGVVVGAVVVAATPPRGHHLSR